VIIAIVGSRDGLNWARVQDRIDELVSRPDVTGIVSGGARGLDKLAEARARRAGKDVRSIKADWKRYGRSAGHRRNPDIIAAGDEVHAFWNERSRGTKGSIDIAKRTEKPLVVYNSDGERIEV
jgi:hypothetical protein